MLKNPLKISPKRAVIEFCNSACHRPWVNVDGRNVREKLFQIVITKSKCKHWPKYFDTMNSNPITRGCKMNFELRNLAGCQWSAAIFQRFRNVKKINVKPKFQKKKNVWKKDNFGKIELEKIHFERYGNFCPKFSHLNYFFKRRASYYVKT